MSRSESNTSNQLQQQKEQVEVEQLKEVGIAVAVVAGIGWAAYQFGRWFFSGSNSKKTMKAREKDVRSFNNEMPSAEGDTQSLRRDFINDKEKLKETVEYKRAMEQEWSLRRQQIRLQAEEAQMLRKKKKAEIMRSSDIKKRQKQRLEELRASQKQKAANLNLKEKLRSEIIKELTVLEKRCFDMASLLRGLGVQVEGGMHPSPQQVRGAYKRAVLKFHPDRTSGSDLKQQVKAEEKFKLISRMKEKYKLR